MSFLGDIGSLYMLFLIALLITGLGMLTKGFFDYLFLKDTKKAGKNKGESKMKNNWLKISVFSLIGIIISMMILSFISTQGISGHSVMGSNSMNQMMSTSTSGTTNAFSMNAINTSTATGAVTQTSDYSSISNDLNKLQQQMKQLQSQMNQLQTMIGNTNGIQSASNGKK